MIIQTTFFCNTITGSNSCLHLHCCITLASEFRYVFQVHERHLPRSSRSGHSGDVSETNGRFCIVPVAKGVFLGLFGQFTSVTYPRRICLLYISHNAPHLPPKILHKDWFQFLLERGYAKFWGANKVHYGKQVVYGWETPRQKQRAHTQACCIPF